MKTTERRRRCLLLLGDPPSFTQRRSLAGRDQVPTLHIRRHMHRRSCRCPIQRSCSLATPIFPRQTVLCHLPARLFHPCLALTPAARVRSSVNTRIPWHWIISRIHIRSLILTWARAFKPTLLSDGRCFFTTGRMGTTNCSSHLEWCTRISIRLDLHRLLADALVMESLNPWVILTVWRRKESMRW